MFTKKTPIQDLLIIEPVVHYDNRGYFLESWRADKYGAIYTAASQVLQFNQSYSEYGVLRGLHYQRNNTQGKLVRVVHGSIWDVVVDLRSDSKTFRRWYGLNLQGPCLSAQGKIPHQQLWVPPGLAHGFIVLSPHAIVEYGCSALYKPEEEVSLHWNDPDLNISWPMQPIHISRKDSTAITLQQIIEKGYLPSKST